MSANPDRGQESARSETDPNAILLEAESSGAADGTARQDGLPQRGIRGVQASEAMAQTDRKRVMQQKEKFEEAAFKFTLPPVHFTSSIARSYCKS
ncbi:MAG: hypothetical protein ACREXW_05675 [Gammaproteobacteria bacterium]